MQPFLNMILLAVLISFSSLAEAEALIAFDQISCTSDILPFVKAEIGNALDLVVQTSAWLIPPLYDEIIQGYVENLFGPGDPISSPRLVFLGLLDFESAFVEVSELSGQEDLVSTVAAPNPSYNLNSRIHRPSIVVGILFASTVRYRSNH